ncbi:glutamine amidotransferase [Pandoraea communis]|uniref:Glutamine amidotransferase n=1 Tax=Pandoraea communis TaxID=2508297 RepID=A0A5E4SLQ6_9BURK|nr:glutamine amidotransferase [Pandoraea communis]MDM8358530.1 glutamine amidotransferase [Pandoraea communis]VVD75258.1 glutamine amidotransferase [Pandoraea communis]
MTASPAPRKTLLALRHVHFEDLGTLAPYFTERGYTIAYVDAPLADLRSIDVLAPDLVVVLGGPIGAFDEAIHPFVADELALVKARLDAGTPILGICLGAQLMARAMGAKVYPLGVKEIGYAPLTLTDAGQTSPLAALGDASVLHWHGDQFDIPAGAEHLARTAIGENQAFASGTHALGLQFHLEADAACIEAWLVGHACELGAAKIDPVALRAQAREHHARLSEVAPAVIGRWLDAMPA